MANDVSREHALSAEKPATPDFLPQTGLSERMSIECTSANIAQCLDMLFAYGNSRVDIDGMSYSRNELLQAYAVADGVARLILRSRITTLLTPASQRPKAPGWGS